MASTQTDTLHLERLRMYWMRHHAFPSIARLCEVVGLSSIVSVLDLVTRLKDASYVERVEGRITPTKRFLGRPLVGHVRAGVPQPAQDDGEFEVLTIDDYLVPDPNRTFVAKVKGESMRDASLLDGDMVVVQQNCLTKVGDIVVAVEDGHAPAPAASRPVFPAGCQLRLRRHPAHRRARNLGRRGGPVPGVQEVTR